MNFSVKYDPDQGYMMSTITGKLTKKHINEVFTKIGEVAAEHECKQIICNLRDTVLSVSINDIFSSVKVLESKQISRSLKRAVVVSQKSEKYLFWETVCSNRGYRNIKIFEDYREAILWLIED